jgi:hypothetical protein
VNVYQIPLSVVYVSIFTPWAANLMLSKSVTFFPILLLLVLLLSSHLIRRISLTTPHIIIFLLVIFHVTFSMITGRGIGSGGTLIIYFFSFSFYYLFKLSSEINLGEKLLKGIGFVYLIHLVGICIELFISLAGFQSFLIDIGGGKLIVNSYKNYNHADFINFLGFTDVRGLASLLLGSQSASQLSVLAFLWFIPIYYGEYKNKVYFSIIALMLIPFVSSMTSLLILSLMILYAVFFLKGSKISKMRYKVAVVLFLLIFNASFYKIIFYKLINDNQIESYYTAFIEPVYRFLSFDVITMIFGEGSRGRKLLEMYGGAGSDFGLMTLINQTGIYLAGMSIFLLLFLLYRVNQNVYRFYKKNGYYNIWCQVATVNAVCYIGWLISLGHYTTAVEVGGREIFAIHIAACLLAVNKLSLLNKNSTINKDGTNNSANLIGGFSYAKYKNS